MVMQTPRCTTVPGADAYRGTLLRGLRYDEDDLVVDLDTDGPSLRLVFEAPIGFRALDERDLCEFWDEYHDKNGWLWEVHAGGWMDLERRRSQFNSHEVIGGLREFLVVGNTCVGVLCPTAPRIEAVGSGASSDLREENRMSKGEGECPKCGGEMQAGFLLDSTTLVSSGAGRPLRWIEAAQIGIGTKVRHGDPGQIEVDAQRCAGCGYLELYAGLGDGPPA